MIRCLNDILVVRISWVPFYYYGLALIPAWINNIFKSKVKDEIIYPFLNFKDSAVEVWEWISQSSPEITRHVIFLYMPRSMFIIVIIMEYIHDEIQPW